MGRWKAIIPIVLAVIIALVGSLLTYRWARQQIAPKEGVKLETQAIAIAVAAIDLPWGAQLTAEQLKLVPYLKQSMPPGSFTDLASLDRRVVITPIRQDEPVLESSLAPTSIATGGVAAVVKTGNRALAVKGDSVIGLAGLIQPGNRVDVLVSLTDPRDEKEITKIVLENILVLATGAEVKKNAQGETQPVDVYTLEVTPEDGEKLSLAATQGKLHFALRNAMDNETVLTSGATIPKTLASFNKVTVEVPAQAVRTKRVSGTGRTLMINGGEASTMTLYQ